MFSFTQEQKVIDLSGVKIGGQPGTYPTVLFGGFFFKESPDLDDAKKKLQNMYDLSKKTGNPAIPDFFIKKTEYMEAIIEFIVENVKGIGYKEGSHFLRNIGYENLAIVDFHIIDLLVKSYMIEKPKTLTKRKYLEIEELLLEVGEQLKLNLAELDLFLWYIETGKVLK